MSDVLALRVAARFAKSKSSPEALVRRVVTRFAAESDPVTKFLQDNVKSISDLSHGMSAEAKKGGAGQFGMKDVREALDDWFHGAPEPKTDKGKAARKYLESDKGKKDLKKLTDGVTKALKDSGKKPGYKDVGEAILKFLT